MVESKHVFPPGEEERPSAKMRAKCVGPCEVVELVGPNAVKVKLTGGLLVFSVDSTKPCKEHMRASSATRGDAEEDGNPTWAPLRVDDCRINESRERREWLVVWTNESEEALGSLFQAFNSKTAPRKTVHMHAFGTCARRCSTSKQCVLCLCQRETIQSDCPASHSVAKPLCRVLLCLRATQSDQSRGRGVHVVLLLPPGDGSTAALARAQSADEPLPGTHTIDDWQCQPLRASAIFV